MRYPTKSAWASAQADQLDRQAAALEAADPSLDWRQRRAREDAALRLIAEAQRLCRMAARFARVAA